MKHTWNVRSILCAVVLFGLSLPALAEETAATNAAADNKFSGLLWSLSLLLLFIFLALTDLTIKIKSIGKEEKPTFSLKQWWARLDARFFTKSIPLEKEANHLLDHDYDGIRELDNSLPPWWKWGFYLSVVFSVFYIMRYHVWKTGPDPEQEYNTEMALASKQIEEYRKKAGELVDEKTVTLADAAGIAEGQKIYQANCFACHGAKGEGGIGPNLTDKFWLHGGSINDVFKSIKYGIPEKGMQAWEKTYSPSQIKNIASYVKSIVGTNPPNGKSPQGDAFEEKAAENKTAGKDSTAVAKR